MLFRPNLSSKEEVETSIMSSQEKEQIAESTLRSMLSQRHTPCQLVSPSSPPAWLDKERCRAGQRYYLSNLVGVMVSNITALLLGMCIPNFYRLLVITRQSHTRESAKYRYEDTAMFLHSWCSSTDCWEEGSDSARKIRRVNAMHRGVARKLRNKADLEAMVDKAFKDLGVDLDDLTDQDRILMDDIATIKENYQVPQEFLDYINNSTPFSQFDMTLVQAAFFFVLILFPDMVGARNDSDQDLADFTHLWRAIGYYLGVEDGNNPVLSSLEETRALARMYYDRILKPCMLHLDKQSLYMAKTAATIKPGLDYHVIVYTGYRMAGFELEQLWNSFSWIQKIRYWVRIG